MRSKGRITSMKARGSGSGRRMKRGFWGMKVTAPPPPRPRSCSSRPHGDYTAIHFARLSVGIMDQRITEVGLAGQGKKIDNCVGPA